MHGLEERATDPGSDEGGLNVQCVELTRGRSGGSEARPAHHPTPGVHRHQIDRGLVRPREGLPALVRICFDRHAIEVGLGHDPGIRGLPAGHAYL